MKESQICGRTELMERETVVMVKCRQTVQTDLKMPHVPRLDQRSASSRTGRWIQAKEEEVLNIWPHKF